MGLFCLIFAIPQNLPKGGSPGKVEFVFQDDGWTIFLTSANGAKQFDASLIPVFDASGTISYGPEYDLDQKIVGRLKTMAAEMEQQRRFKKAIVLHCNHGRTRSVVCLRTYLMQKYPTMSAADALKMLKAIFTSSVQDVTLDSAPRNVVPHFHHAVGERVEGCLTAFENFRT